MKKNISARLANQLMIFLSVILMTFQLQAQVSNQTTQFKSIKRNIATVFLCGLGGAVLGLSTLSFYGQPQEQVGNITTGFGIGLIAGTVYVFSQNRQDPYTQTTPEISMIPKSLKKGEKFYPLFAYSWSF